MRKFTEIVFCLLLVWTPVYSYAQAGQQEVPLSETDAVYGFCEYLPEDYSDGENFPLIVFLHGLGEIGDGELDLWKVKVHGPPKLIERGKDFPAVVLSPQSENWWDIKKLGQFVDWAFLNYQIDTTRLYVTGLSMGGGGTWLYAVNFPERPAAIIPIAGAADTIRTKNLVDIPVWAFHNAVDHVVDVKLTYDWIKGIRSAGGSPEITIYPKEGHDAWTETYSNEEVWDWLFAQKREPKEPEPEPLVVSKPANTIRIYPNPFKDHLNFKFSGYVHTARLVDMGGKQVTEWWNVERQGNDNTINVAPQISSGVYLLELESAHGVQRFRVVKE